MQLPCRRLVTASQDCTAKVALHSAAVLLRAEGHARALLCHCDMCKVPWAAAVPEAFQNCSAKLSVVFHCQL